MIADYFTKALQGNLFRAMRDTIMGLESFDSLKERVEKRSICEEKIKTNKKVRIMTEPNDLSKTKDEENSSCTEQKATYADKVKFGLSNK